MQMYPNWSCAQSRTHHEKKRKKKQEKFEAGGIWHFYLLVFPFSPSLAIIIYIIFMLFLNWAPTCYSRKLLSLSKINWDERILYFFPNNNKITNIGYLLVNLHIITYINVYIYQLLIINYNYFSGDQGFHFKPMGWIWWTQKYNYEWITQNRSSFCILFL